MNKIRLHNTMSLTAVLSAVLECRAKSLGDPQRIIVVLGPPGFELSELFRRAVQHHGALLVPAGPMEPTCVTYLKRLANRTRVVPLLLASAETWRQWTRRRPQEAAQIRRRTHLVVELEARPSTDLHSETSIQEN
jgi:hypothetical protein